MIEQNTEHRKIKKNRIGLICKIILSITLTVVLLGFLFSRIQLSEIKKVFLSLQLEHLAAGFMLYLLGYFFRILRFRALLGGEPPPIVPLTAVVCIHNMANKLLPVRTGEISFPYLLKKIGKKSTGTGISSLMAARILDLASVGFVFFVSSIIIRNEMPEKYKMLWIPAAVLSGVAILALAGMIFFTKKFFMTHSLPSQQNATLIRRTFYSSLRALTAISNTNLILAIFWSMGLWFSFYGMFNIYVKGMGQNLGFFESSWGATISVFTYVLPISGVGGFGTHEAGWTLGFTALGIEFDAAVAAGFAVNVICAASAIILGIAGAVGFYALRRQRANSNVQGSGGS